MEFKEIENKYWNSVYEKNELNYNANRDLPFHDDFKSYLKNLPANSRVLELACGVRCDGIEIARAGMKVYETDISEVAVEKARRIYAQLKIEDRGEFQKCDAENLPFSNGYFQGVFIAASFHHLPNPVQALKEMTRVTDNNGYVILGVEPNAWPYYTVFLMLEPLKFLLRKKEHKILSSIADDQTHGFTKRSFRKICQSADLEIIKISRVKYLAEYYDSGLRLFSKIFRKNFTPQRRTQIFLCRVDAIIAKIPILNLFNWHWNVICRKK